MTTRASGRKSKRLLQLYNEKEEAMRKSVVADAEAKHAALKARLAADPILPELAAARAALGTHTKERESERAKREAEWRETERARLQAGTLEREVALARENAELLERVEALQRSVAQSTSDLASTREDHAAQIGALMEKLSSLMEGVDTFHAAHNEATGRRLDTLEAEHAHVVRKHVSKAELRLAIHNKLKGMIVDRSSKVVLSPGLGAALDAVETALPGTPLPTALRAVVRDGGPSDASAPATPTTVAHVEPVQRRVMPFHSALVICIAAWALGILLGTSAPRRGWVATISTSVGGLLP